ncbi:non-canonical ubiquitin conjugating enzyme 1 [Halteromyces radiatus]|uniref:non-canonical ubiquitin conjugating enzyme 1 n=1 Tax=Halteromyces radiatus TaxID=101107 RepID=UPI0022208711|nr:non-canonical ubiquitin conjugating enzyme 1 [Halteromyces radiatus]KAI8100058.1 non-canonical ubiquitin conjugating enzyme 1 [Halteromyces radiatus]
MPPSYNYKNSAVKRILQEAKELAKEQTNEYEGHPLEDDIFEWHFTVSGPVDTEFEGGRYHGRILLPAEYPFKPPQLIFLTPNGRFELNTKVCLSITDHHPEFWQPAWGIRTVLLAIMGFFPTSAKGAVGGLDYPKDERQRLAKISKDWRCDVCKMKNSDIIIQDDSSIPKKPVRHTDDDLPSFTFTATDIDDKPYNTSSSSSSSTSAITHYDTSNIIGSSDSSSTVISTRLSSSSSSSSSVMLPSGNRKMISKTTTKKESPSLSSPSSTSSSPVLAPTTRRRTSAPPLWLDTLIGLCITLLVYILYQKYL